MSQNALKAINDQISKNNFDHRYRLADSSIQTYRNAHERVSQARSRSHSHSHLQTPNAHVRCPYLIIAVKTLLPLLWLFFFLHKYFPLRDQPIRFSFLLCSFLFDRLAKFNFDQ